MKTQYPSYYPRFHCIASACKHTCCAGWEIDVDEVTLARYQTMPEGEREAILSTISNEGIPHFALQGACERCPHLDDTGLCRIIARYGEAYTPNICRDHPRYRHMLTDGVEYGVGLACEAACQLILGTQERVSIGIPEGQAPLSYTEEEQELIDVRQELRAQLQDRALPIQKRFHLMCEKMGMAEDSLPLHSILGWYDVLEYQSREWAEGLASIQEKQDATLFFRSENALYFEQLTLYFIHRHLLDALEDGYVEERVAFSLLSSYLIALLATTIAGEKTDFERICEAARIYSTEIEYSTENTDILLENLSEILWG